MNGELVVCDHARHVVYALQLKYGWTQQKAVRRLVEAASHQIFKIMGTDDAPTSQVMRYLPDKISGNDDE
jgi:L-asparaginase II